MKNWKVLFFNLISKDTVSHLYFCLETPAGRVDILLLIMNTLHTCGLLIIISLIIQFQCDLPFFSTEIVNCRSCCWIPLINFVMI